MKQGDTLIVNLLRKLVGAATGTPGSGGYQAKYRSVLKLVGSSSSIVIPAGVLGWSMAVTSGTFATWNDGSGAQSVGVGQSADGGGYGGMVTDRTITIATASGTTALVEYDQLA